MKSLIDKSSTEEPLVEHNVSQWVEDESKEDCFSNLLAKSYSSPTRPIIVFFDEFDSDREGRHLGWLKSFLEPMEDGIAFPSNKHANNLVGKFISPAQLKKAKTNFIFLFGGGTSPTYQQFSREGIFINPKERADFAAVKGPDFVSRLRGHINILGPNPMDDNDELFLVRRALVIRNLLFERIPVEKDKKDKMSVFEINNLISKTFDRPVIRAMLQVTSYKHGMRSIRSILDMWAQLGAFSNTGYTKRVVATLPALEQLNMHVDGSEFLYTVLEAQKELKAKERGNI